MLDSPCYPSICFIVSHTRYIVMQERERTFRREVDFSNENLLFCQRKILVFVEVLYKLADHLVLVSIAPLRSENEL